MTLSIHPLLFSEKSFLAMGNLSLTWRHHVQAKDLPTSILFLPCETFVGEIR